MEKVIDPKKALEFTAGYFDLLEAMGYARHDITVWYLVYLFLMEFYGSLYGYMDSEDIRTLDRAFVNLFSGHNCLVPYTMLRGEYPHPHLDPPHYTGPAIVRMPETGGNLRDTEHEELRRYVR